MASKKYSLLTGILCLLASYGFSQTTTGTGYDVADSSVISAKSMPQHTEFMNGTYNYPAKPRNQWEIGVKGGLLTIAGDVAPRPGFGGGIHIRKAFGYLFSARLEYRYGVAKGLNWTRSSAPGIFNNQGWRNAGYTAANTPGGVIFSNFKTNIQDLSLEGVLSLNNIRFHKSAVGVNYYALAGVGAMVYEAKINALNASNQRYDFSRVTGYNEYKNRRDVKSQLKDLMDDSYETPAENHGNRRAKLFGKTLRPVGHIGGGVAFKLSNRMNLAIEDRFTVTKDDLIDGQQWSEQGDLSRDYDTYNYVTVGLNFNVGSKAVQPLWWLNPLDYAYQEIRKPRLMILPKPVLPDTDGDGITDQFDQEQTPAGCPVDAHGVSLDTDGDGVPDCRDKEKITPTTCQPVDADGVGKCPCPADSCGLKAPAGNECATLLGTLPSVTFTGNGVTLSQDAQSLLASVAARLRQNPTCRVVVTSYCASTKQQQQRSWDRVNAVINYMVEKEGITADRFFFNYGQEGGDCNTVDMRAAAADEQGQTTVPAPHPSLRKGK